MVFRFKLAPLEQAANRRVQKEHPTSLSRLACKVATLRKKALRVLWNLDEADTRDCMAYLTARPLATRATDGTSLILHDLQRDLIHKRREKDMPSLHFRLVKGWDGLPKLPDAYAWRWIAYHTVKAGRKDDLRRLC